MDNATLAALTTELATYTAWSDANPLKKCLIANTLDRIARAKIYAERAERERIATAKAATKAALPWYKQIFA